MVQVAGSLAVLVQKDWGVRSVVRRACVKLYKILEESE